LSFGGPIIVRVRFEKIGYIAVLDRRRKHSLVLGVDRCVHRVRTDVLARLICEPIEVTTANVDAAVNAMALTGPSRTRVRAALARDQAGNHIFRDCWAILPDASEPLRARLGGAGVFRNLGILTCAQIAQYALFLSSWFLLGRAVLSGTLDP